MRTTVLFFSSLLFAASALSPQTSAPPAQLGFDRNDYPGDAALPILRKSFSFTGYWLSSPPGENSNSWTGKRDILRSHGFGFALLFAGQLQVNCAMNVTLSSGSLKIRRLRPLPHGAKAFLQAPLFFWM